MSGKNGDITAAFRDIKITLDLLWDNQWIMVWDDCTDKYANTMRVILIPALWPWWKSSSEYKSWAGFSIFRLMAITSTSGVLRKQSDFSRTYGELQSSWKKWPGKEWAMSQYLISLFSQMNIADRKWLRLHTALLSEENKLEFSQWISEFARGRHPRVLEFQSYVRGSIEERKFN